MSTNLFENKSFILKLGHKVLNVYIFYTITKMRFFSYIYLAVSGSYICILLIYLKLKQSVFIRLNIKLINLSNLT